MFVVKFKVYILHLSDSLEQVTGSLIPEDKLCMSLSIRSCNLVPLLHLVQDLVDCYARYCLARMGNETRGTI